jgi:hypothetical protein
MPPADVDDLDVGSIGAPCLHRIWVGGHRAASADGDHGRFNGGVRHLQADSNGGWVWSVPHASVPSACRIQHAYRIGGHVRRAARRDDSEPEVIAAFRSGGASVWQLNDPNLPDLAVGHRRVTHHVEVKSGNKYPSENQAEAFQLWKGEPVELVRSAAEAIALLRSWEAKSRKPKERP